MDREEGKWDEKKWVKLSSKTLNSSFNFWVIYFFLLVSTYVAEKIRTLNLAGADRIYIFC